ncbi:MAG: OmpA family protein [Parasphingorhabdus sp.]
MKVGAKLLTGAAATALLAIVGHFTTSDGLVAKLESKAQTELTAQGMDGVKVTFSRDPLSRSAILDGDVDDDTKQAALQTVMSIPGVSAAKWQGKQPAETSEGSSADGSSALDPVTQEKITKCQDDVDQITEAKKITFRSGSAYVSPVSNKILNEVAGVLKSCDGLTVAVGGHTDNNGDASVNKTMSQERADRVRQGLIDRGIAEDLITATGYGSEQPLAEGAGVDIDAQNRRIEFKVQTNSGATAPQGG